jgi:hypothetical protein
MHSAIGTSIVNDSPDLYSLYHFIVTFILVLFTLRIGFAFRFKGIFCLWKVRKLIYESSYGCTKIYCTIINIQYNCMTMFYSSLISSLYGLAQGQFCGHGEHGQIMHGAQMQGQLLGPEVVGQVVGFVGQVGFVGFVGQVGF